MACRFQGSVCSSTDASMSASEDGLVDAWDIPNVGGRPAVVIGQQDV